MKISTPDKILFRCHALSDIMTDAKGKNPFKERQEMLIEITLQKNKYAAETNKKSVKAQKILGKIQQLNTRLLKLDDTKDEIRLGSVCIERILKTYADQVEGRRQSIKSKYLDKGLYREEDAITLLSINSRQFYRKNTERLKNGFITGEPDLYKGYSIRTAKRTIDTKCSWSLETFLKSKFAPLSSDYEYQGHGYMWLTGAEHHDVAFCLVNGMPKTITDEKRRLAYEMDILDPDVETDSKFLDGCMQIERNHIFDINLFCKENPGFDFHNEVKIKNGDYQWDFDIPKEKRIHIKTIERNDGVIKEIEERIIDCRRWMAANLF